MQTPGNRGRVKLVFVLAAALTLGLLAADRGWAMGKMVLFSAAQGRVLLQGKPVAGATVDREVHWTWKDEVRRDSTTTDAGGNFKLPAVVGQSLLSFMPHEPLVRQALTIRHEGRSYEAWVHTKRNYDDNGELGGRPLRLTCRLEAEPAKKGTHFGLCDID